MGLYAAKNAILVTIQLELGNSASRLFVYMALECWDDDDNPAGGQPRRYFGSRETSALALGFGAPENGTEKAFRAVKRAVHELVTAGAIRRIRGGGSGRNAEFELQVDSNRPPSARQRSGGNVIPFRRELGTDFWSPQGADF